MEIFCLSEYEKIIKRSKNVSNSYLYTDSTEKFKITKHKDGNYPAIVTISGFFSEDLDNRLDWENSILSTFPDREWFHVEWNSQKHPLKKIKSNKLSVLLKSESFQKPKNFISFYISKISIINKLINNPWHLAVRNSKHTGELLAKSLFSCKQKQFVLIGHSLGARVIHNCLEYFAIQELASNIVDVHLLGGAVNSRKKKWEKASKMIIGNAYNYYSKNDYVLREAFAAIMLDDYPIGLCPVENHKFRNINSSIYILGHTEYIKNFHVIRHS